MELCWKFCIPVVDLKTWSTSVQHIPPVALWEASGSCLFVLRCASASFLRWWSFSTWQTGWFTGCGAEAWTPTISPSLTWLLWVTCWGLASLPSASTCAGSLATGTRTQATECTQVKKKKINPTNYTCTQWGISPVCLDFILNVDTVYNVRANLL